MAPSSAAVCAPYTRAVVNAMRRLYPEALADKSFDNTGLLLEAPFNPDRRQRNSVLLTIDLTKAVADEAIARKDSIIVAYHPIIFRGLKSLTLEDTQQQSLLRLAAEGISVYSPHTAIDCARGGLGDWLADIVSAKIVPAAGIPSKAHDEEAHGESREAGSSLQQDYLHIYQQTWHLSNSRALKLGKDEHKRYPIVPTNVQGHEGAGMGRIVHLATPVPLKEIIDRIRLGVGNTNAFPLAIPQGKLVKDIKIRSIALCAGSGGHLFSEAEKAGEDADLLFTGELSHHEALAAIERGRCVISLFHSNSERGFLHTVLKGQLEKAVDLEWHQIRREHLLEGAPSTPLKEALADPDVEVRISEADQDPYGLVIAQPSQWL